MKVETKPNQQRWYWYMLLALLAIVTLIQLGLIGRGDLFCDEAYYWEWSRHLDFGYVDHPPMIAYVIFLFTTLGGDSEFMVRLGSVFFTAGTSILIYLISKNLFRDEIVGFFSALLFNLIPGFLLIGSLATPDAPQIFFWTLTLYLTHKSLTKTRCWYLAGVSLGLALLCKYIAILLVPSVFLFLLLSSDHRCWLRRKEPYLALFIAFLIFSPVILWNAGHGWISFIYQLSHGALEAQTANFWGGLWEYAILQFQLLSPGVYLFCIVSMIVSGYLGLVKKESAFIFLFCASVPTILFFTLLNGMPHWAFPGYIGSMIALIRLIQLSLHSSKLSTIKAAVFLPTCFAVFCLPLLISTQYLSEINFVGWRDLGEKVNEVMAELPNPRQTFIMGHRFPVLSEIAYYSNRSFKLYTSAFDDYSQHSLWTEDDLMVGGDAIFILEEDSGKKLLDLQPLLQDTFDSVEMMIFPVKREGVIVKRFYIFTCLGFRGI